MEEHVAKRGNPFNLEISVILGIKLIKIVIKLELKNVPQLPSTKELHWFAFLFLDRELLLNQQARVLFRTGSSRCGSLQEFFPLCRRILASLTFGGEKMRENKFEFKKNFRRSVA